MPKFIYSMSDNDSEIAEETYTFGCWLELGPESTQWMISGFLFQPVPSPARLLSSLLELTFVGETDCPCGLFGFVIKEHSYLLATGSALLSKLILVDAKFIYLSHFTMTREQLIELR